MSQFTYISLPKKIDIGDLSYSNNLFYPIIFGQVEEINEFLDLCFNNKFHYTIGINIMQNFMGVSEPVYRTNFDGFDTDENYQGLVYNNIYPEHSLEHPKPYLLKFEKKLDDWVTTRAYFRKELYKVIDSILSPGEFVEIFSEIENGKNAHRLYKDKTGPPMLQKTLHISNILEKESVENLTQHMMKVTILK